MRLRTRRILLPMLFGLSWAVQGCSPRERIQPIFPPVADLEVEPKPPITPEVLTSAQAAAEYDIKLESWGERGWRAVARICRWAKDNGATVDCPSVPRE